MSQEHASQRTNVGQHGLGACGTAIAPGKRTLVESMASAPAAPVQRVALANGPAPAPEVVRSAAARGTTGSPGALPHQSRIQQLFGRHDISGIRAHVGGAAADGATEMGAHAFATGDQVAFARSPDLHTAAHEAAHVVQQRGGVQLKGGVDSVGDAHERHADEVADRVVRGESAEQLLDAYAGGRDAGSEKGVRAAVQRKPIEPDPQQHQALQLAVTVAKLRLQEVIVGLSLQRVGAQIPLTARQLAMPEHVQALLGNAPIPEVLEVLRAIKAQLVLCEGANRLVLCDGIGANDPFASRQGALALNVDEGANATIYVNANHLLTKTADQLAHTLIHEASHGAPEVASEDLAYTDERIFPFLANLGARPIDNADHIANFTMVAATGQPHAEPPPPDQLENGLSGEAAQPVRMALGMVGLGARLVSTACGPLLAYLATCKEEGHWTDEEEDEDACADVERFRSHELLLANDTNFAGHILFITALQHVAHTLHMAAGGEKITFRADPNPAAQAGPVQWQAGNSVVLVRPQAAEWTADQLAEQLLRQGLLQLRLPVTVAPLFGTFLRDLLAPAEDDSGSEIENEGEDENEGEHEKED